MQCTISKESGPTGIQFRELQRSQRDLLQDMLYCSCEWNWVLVFKRDGEWIVNLRGKNWSTWTNCWSWKSGIPPLFLIQPHLSMPTLPPTTLFFHSPLSLLGCCVYKQTGHSVLQVSSVGLGALATLKLNPSYQYKPWGFTSEAVVPSPRGPCVLLCNVVRSKTQRTIKVSW